jgi:hypothetical protein
MAAKKAKTGHTSQELLCRTWRVDAIRRCPVICFVSCDGFLPLTLRGLRSSFAPEQRASYAVQARLAGAPNAYHTDPVPGITSNVT